MDLMIYPYAVLSSLLTPRTIFTLIGIFLIGCTSKKSHELEVINATFMDMVGTYYYNEPQPPPPYKPIHPDSIYNEIEGELELTIELDGVEYEPKDSLTRAKEWKLQRDSLLDEFHNFDWAQYDQDSMEWHELLNKPKRDKRNIILQINESLIVPRFDFLDLSYELTKEGFKTNFQLDDSWRTLTSKLLESKLNKEPFNFQVLSNIGDYELRPVNFEPSEQDRVVATLTFSRVVFNQGKNQACYYYKEYCGRNCGYGYLVFVERINGEWKLKAKRQLWIS
ncbi:hypothetical protein [Echinicola rosea]|uniref:Lipoprotein n=1 Tax=Echinicola rosea TaxID=1807691 RepID=A0ABQ1VCR8_9BACT|nr:hypothetical protein [Echinicola rosea]GGF50753.1 hypothetical protein GCM10011339_44110 [Echinicola rosea]